MKDRHEGCERGFTIFSESWYSKNPQPERVVDEIMIGMYHPEGGTTGEFGVRWTMLGRELTPRLEVFNDAWDALLRFDDLLRWMAEVDDKRVTPQAFADALRGLGIKDLTQRVNPYASHGELEYASWFECGKTPNVL